MPQTLEYSRELYRGEYRMRSANGILAAIVSGLAAVGQGALLATIHEPSGFGLFLRLVFVAGVIYCAGACVYLAAGAWKDKKEPFIISTDGIVVRGELTPWERITVLSCYLRQGEEEVTPFFRATGFYTRVCLRSTPRLSRAEYQKMIQIVGMEILPLHPNLKLRGYQREA